MVFWITTYNKTVIAFGILPSLPIEKVKLNLSVVKNEAVGHKIVGVINSDKYFTVYFRFMLVGHPNYKTNEL